MQTYSRSKERTRAITFVLTCVVTCVCNATAVADNAAILADIFVTCISERIFKIIRYAFGLGREIQSHEYR